MPEGSSRLTLEELRWRPEVPTEDLSWDEMVRIDRRVGELLGEDRDFEPIMRPTGAAAVIQQAHVQAAWDALGRAAYRKFVYSGPPPSSSG